MDFAAPSRNEKPPIDRTLATPGVSWRISLIVVHHRGGPLQRGGVGQIQDGQGVALVLDGQEAGRQVRVAPDGRADQQRERGHGQQRPADQVADDPGVEPLDVVVDVVEAAEEDVLPPRHGPQVRRRLGGLERQGVDGADDRRGGDGHGELAVELAGDPAHERHGDEDGHQHQGDPDDRAGHLRHRLDRRLAGRHPLLDVVGGVLDDDDRVVDHDADGQHQAEERQQVHGVAQRGQRGEGADDRHRDGRRRDQDAAPVLQEDQDDDEHQHAGLDQRLVDLVDRLLDEERGVEGDLVGHVLREVDLARRSIGLCARSATSSALAPGSWKMARLAAGRPLFSAYWS